MVVIPATTPVTIPDAEPMLAVPGAAELQLPPVVASLSVVVSPEHTDVAPVMAAGLCTVTVLTAAQPSGRV